MKRKSFVSILIVLLALFSLTRCKLAEVETIDEIPCPGVGIDTVIIRRTRQTLWSRPCRC